jgi:hypothetical protein
MFKLFAVASIANLTNAVRLDDSSDPLGRNVDNSTHWDMHISGYNGADEDEIMDNIFSKFSKEGLTSTGHKTGQKLLMKDDAKLAAGQILEAAHFMKPADVPAFLNTNFESTWNYFDQNHEGWIRYEETHTFQRYIQGTLNKFALAPGSLSDMASGGAAYNSIVPVGTPVIAVGRQ